MAFFHIYKIITYNLLGDVMLKRMSIRKIIVASFTLMVLFVFYLIPSSKDEYELDLKTSGVEYVYPNNFAVIYLLDSNDYVARTLITSCNCEGKDKAVDLLEGLIIDGKKSNIIPNGFRSIIPSGTSINNIVLEDGVLTIDFSSELLEVKSEYEEKMIESIIFTLTSIQGIDKVIIKVEGKILERLPYSKKIIPTVLDKDYGINKSYELVSVNDIESYTLYYVNSYNDNYYYVPVTKYVNNNSQDKIKVIIEELSTSPVYESSLMSFLNVSTKLLNYEIVDNTLKLNFNNMILNDVTSNNILEEVVYTVGLSMSDNLDVEEVVFMVENEEIYKFLPKTIE